MARDPASGVIHWFGVLMVVVFLASVSLVGLLAWGVLHAVRCAFGG